MKVYNNKQQIYLLLYKTLKHQNHNMNTKYHHKYYSAVEIDPIQKVTLLFDLDPINSSKNSIKSQQQQVVNSLHLSCNVNDKYHQIQTITSFLRLDSIKQLKWTNTNSNFTI